MWQKRLDLVPDQVLCNEYIEDKDDAHYAGKGLHWVLSPRCTLCHRIRTSLQAPMPEHAAPRPFQKLPALLSKRRRLLLKKRPIACPPSLFMPRIQEYALYTTDTRGVDTEAAILGQSMGMRVHTIAGPYHYVLRDTLTIYPFGSHQALRDMGETEQMVNFVSSLGKNLLLCDVTTGQ